ncbi:MAG: hypothetical protein ACKVU1_10925 [bacterium]
MTTREECQRAIAIYESALLEFKNVESVAIVDDEDGHSVGIIVSRKIPYDDLEEDDLLPAYLQLIDSLKGVIRVKTRVIARDDVNR